MIKVVRGPVEYGGNEPNVLFIDDKTSCYSISYKFGSGSVSTYVITKEIAEAIAETVEVAMEVEQIKKAAEQVKAQATAEYQRQPIKLREEQKPVTDVGQMVDKGYTAQDLINLKREGII